MTLTGSMYLHVQVSIVDVSEGEGQVACADLQRDFHREHIMFLPADVSRKEDLVGEVASEGLI